MFQNFSQNQEDIYEEEIADNGYNTRANRLKTIFSVQNIAIYILAFMISRIGFGDNLLPFGIAFFAACCSNLVPSAVIFSIIGLATGITFGKEALLTYILTSLIFIGLMLIRKPAKHEKENLNLMVYLFISVFIVQAVSILFKTFLIYDLLTSIMLCISSCIFYKIFTNSIGVIKDFGSKKIYTSEEVIGASLMIAIAICGIGNFNIFGFSIRNILSILLVLILGWKNGILVGGTAGITIGVMLGVIGVGDTALIASFAFSGMLAGIFSKFGKIGVVVGFALGNIILTFVANGSIIALIYFREILIASLGLLAMPKKLEINIEDLIGKTKALPQAATIAFEKNDETIHKLNSVSEVISTMAEGFEEAAATVVEIDEIACDIENDTIINVIEDDENIADLDRMYKLNQIWESKLEENKQIAKDQLKGVSKVLSQMANELENNNTNVGAAFEGNTHETDPLCPKTQQFNIQLGISRTTKNKSETSGDSNISVALEDGKYLLAISDGMGSRSNSQKQ